MQKHPTNRRTHYLCSHASANDPALYTSRILDSIMSYYVCFDFSDIYKEIFVPHVV